jgi:hypothetical protein
MFKHATTYGGVERIAFAKSELFAQDTPFQPAETAPLSKGKHRLACGIYLITSAVATFGWVWLLARITLRLIQSVAGFWPQ